jgi:hypothetical protein
MSLAVMQTSSHGSMEGHVYFAAAATGSIKIGFTSDVGRRLTELSYATGHPLSLLTSVFGDRKTEGYFHRKHAPDNLIGEWFRPSADVLSTIDDVKGRGSAAVPPQYRLEVPTQPVLVERDEVVEACRDYCVAIAGERIGSEKIADLIARASALTGVHERMIRMIWYREATSIKAHIYIRLKEVFEAREASQAGAGR